MATLAVIAYTEEQTAGEAAVKLASMQKEYLIELEDIAWVTNKGGKLKLHQGANLTAAGATGGAMWGFIFGLLFFAPFLGAAIGAASGALMGKLSDYGIDDKWAKEVAGSIPVGGSALFVMARSANADRVVPEMARFGGTVIRTNLSAEQEKNLADALSHDGA